MGKRRLERTRAALKNILLSMSSQSQDLGKEDKMSMQG